jgi:hypothetical protein
VLPSGGGADGNARDLESSEESRLELGHPVPVEVPMTRGRSLLLARLAAASFVLLMPSLLPARAAAQSVDGKAAFERLKSLAGTWEGQAGHGQPGQAATVTYRVASGGSVVEETLFPGTPHEMISMYHLVDGQLVMTHYCALANQPRMRLDAKASTPDRLVFAFDGGTNFDPAKDTHIHSGVVEWKGESLHNSWAVYSGGKETGQHRFVLERKK